MAPPEETAGAAAFRKVIADKTPLVFDGAMGTELYEQVRGRKGGKRQSRTAFVEVLAAVLLVRERCVGSCSDCPGVLC